MHFLKSDLRKHSLLINCKKRKKALCNLSKYYLSLCFEGTQVLSKQLRLCNLGIEDQKGLLECAHLLIVAHQENRLLRCLAIKKFILTAKPKGFSHLVVLIASQILEDIYTTKRRLPWRLGSDGGTLLTCWSRDASVFLQFITGINWG